LRSSDSSNAIVFSCLRERNLISTFCGRRFRPMLFSQRASFLVLIEWKSVTKKKHSIR
jgi:hypothetical protein